MKAIEQYFPVVLFIILYKVVLTFESVDEVLKWDHSDESLVPSYPGWLQREVGKNIKYLNNWYIAALRR